MQRRKFVKISLQGTSTALLLPASLLAESRSSKTSPITSNKNVIIIGAGIAGLAAAKSLQNKGISVQIIEAQAKVGGRIRTDRSLGFPFDEGASWIHGARRKNPIAKLAKRSNAKMSKTDGDNVKIYDENGTAYLDVQIDQSERALKRILKEWSGSSHQSFEEVFFTNNPQYQNNRLWKYLLSAYLEFDIGGDISKLSSLDFDDDKAFKGKDKFITNGFDQITEYMSEGLDIMLNTKITAIDYTNSKSKLPHRKRMGHSAGFISDPRAGELNQMDYRPAITIHANTGVFEADFVIITVPLGVLKQNVISFVPKLPSSKQQAIRNLQIGAVNKFICVWDKAFWDTNLQYIGYTPEIKGKFNYFLNLKKNTPINALMTFTFGDYSKHTEGMTDAQVINEIMNHLKSIYGNNIPNPSNMLRSKWHSNEFAFGSYSFVSKNARASDFDILSESVSNKLFFAGEHTSRDYRGTTHGAFLSGEREAKKIIDLILN